MDGSRPAATANLGAPWIFTQPSPPERVTRFPRPDQFPDRTAPGRVIRMRMDRPGRGSVRSRSAVRVRSAVRCHPPAAASELGRPMTGDPI
ncbi:hypothetical protein GCM10020229_63130 [Kitasatospora albolonga]